MARIEQGNGLSGTSSRPDPKADLTAQYGPDSGDPGEQQTTDKYGFMGGAQQYSGEA